MKIDDIISSNITPTNKQNNLIGPKVDDVFMIKIDAQGSEPAVFAGLSDSIREKKIHYILFEYWPKGIDLIEDKNENCVAPVQILEKLISAGYTIYSFANESHAIAPIEVLRYISDSSNIRPVHDLKKNCMWHYEVEEKCPSDEYKMGYWSNILCSDAILGDQVEDILKVVKLRFPRSDTEFPTIK